ncbi:diguanylate cyclase domain-containing protein [Hydrogenophaga atypica]|uniref:Diguanylate cyclase domain-containing protein n=1 Tax=Hydrogenophaga atypica TaxID=249409 RepID=A0ABW2QNJ7_9BURK
MKFGIALKLSLLLALAGALAAGLTGYYAFEASRTLLVNAAKDRLLTSTLVLARRVALAREEIERDLVLVAEHPAARALLQGPGTPSQQQTLQDLMVLMLQSQPSYFQVRLIAADQHGMERVRVDRAPRGPMVVADDDLQEKGHFDYVSQALRLGPDQTYMSRVAINHERGSHLGVDKPSLQLARPVRDAQGRTLGVAVINIDLNGTFELLAKDMPESIQLYFANHEGDILIHPEPAKTFGFDRGRRIFIQDEFAATGPVVRGDNNVAVFESHEGAHANQPVVAAFMSQPLKVSSPETRLTLGLTQPLQAVLADSNRLGQTVLQIVLALCALSLLLALWMGRALTRPINAISHAARMVASGLPAGALPVERRDEIGDLARAFRDMRLQIGEQISELRDNQDELEHLAQHDPLTGLANRRKFQERLDHALAQARRVPQTVSVLFIDLDRFKPINDHHGHDVGDVVLQTVARRLKGVLREVDTVARIGGDEFVALLGAPATQEQLEAIARKLLTLVSEPMVVDKLQLDLGCSIGIASYPDHASTATDLLAAADHAMYQAKTAGRNTFRFFDATPPAA